MKILSFLLYIIPFVLEQISKLFKKKPKVKKVEKTETDFFPFDLHRYCKSMTALQHGIKNIPNEEQEENLRYLHKKCIKRLVKKYGKEKFVLNSGFRCLELNRLIKSKDTSQHTKGQAADVEFRGIDNESLFNFIRRNLNFDQVILEFYNREEGPNSGWVHVSYSKDKNRLEALKAIKGADGKIYYKKC